MSEMIVGRIAFTPGPWLDSNRTFRTHNHPDRYWERHIHTAQEITLGGTASGASLEEAEANARLIALAPEMLELLKRIEGSLDPTLAWEGDMRDRIVALVAKLEGR